MLSGPSIIKIVNGNARYHASDAKGSMPVEMSEPRCLPRPVVGIGLKDALT